MARVISIHGHGLLFVYACRQLGYQAFLGAMCWQVVKLSALEHEIICPFRVKKDFSKSLRVVNTMPLIPTTLLDDNSNTPSVFRTNNKSSFAPASVARLGV